MDIYWIKDKKKHGPQTVPDILSLVQMGELTPDTLGWHAGCANWIPLKELPALADFLNSPKNTAEELPVQQEPEPLPGTVALPISLHSSQKVADASAISIPLPRTRLMARLIDSSLYAAIAAGVVYLLQIPFTEVLLPLFWAPMIVLEALLITYRGTTPGKSLMGIAVSSIGSHHKELTFGRAFMRSLAVNVMGMGCYLFPVGLITMLISYFILTRRGITLWDLQNFTLPIQKRKAGVSHFLLGGVLIYFAMQLMSQALIRTPGTLEMLEQSAPEMARTLQEMMPDLAPPAEQITSPVLPEK